MKTKLFMIFFSMLSTVAHSQEIRLYHGIGNQSTYFLEDDKEVEKISRWKDSTVFIRPFGDKVEIVVLNPNPFLYTYELKLEEFKIQEDFPDIADLLNAINSIPNISKESAENNPLFPAKNSPVRGVPISDFTKYHNILTDLSSEIQAVKKAITNSDIPESRAIALNTGSPDGGFRMAVAIIKLQSSEEGHFNDPNLEKNLEKYLNKAIDDGSIIQNISTATDQQKAKETYKQAFTLLNNQLIAIIGAIKKTSQEEPMLRYIVPVAEKNLKVRLVVKKKTGNADKQRTEFDHLLCVIIPEYRRAAIELVPLVNLTYASNSLEFGTNNGVITQSNGDGFKFRAGVMLLYNFKYFGKYKDGAWGAGLGYTIPQKGVLENFQLGTMVSYKQLFRVGLGAGFSPYPSGLKNELKNGDPLPSTIKNLEDVVDYKRKLSFFINFSISGITILKK